MDETTETQTLTEEQAQEPEQPETPEQAMAKEPGPETEPAPENDAGVADPPAPELDHVGLLSIIIEDLAAKPGTPVLAKVIRRLEKARDELAGK